MRTVTLLPVGIAVLLGCPSMAPSQTVVINEIHYHVDDGTVGGSEDPEDLQFVELCNQGTTSISLAGWYFGDGISHVFGTGITIDVGEHIVLAKDATFLQSTVSPSIPSGTQVFTWGGGDLENGGETLTLYDNLGLVVDTVDFDDSPPWPSGADGFGPSAELVHPSLDNSFGSVWRASSGTNGTPGVQNSAYSLAPIILSETPTRSSIITNLNEVAVTFAEPVEGVVASNLAVASSLATNVTCDDCVGGIGVGPYHFSGFDTPTQSPVTVALSPGVIEDEGGNPFAGDTWIYGFDPPDIVINELHYNPDGGDDLEEFIELYNAEGEAVDISGWSLKEFSAEGYTFPGATVLADGDYIVVARYPAALQAATGCLTTHQWDPDDKLANGGETVALTNTLGIIVDEVTYSDSAPWPDEPDGDGPSLELMNPLLDNGQPGAWKPSIGNHGTPGQENSVASDIPQIVAELPLRGTAVESLTEVTVVFSTAVENVTAGDFMVAGSAATAVTPPSGPADTYTFSGFNTPPVGSVVVMMGAGAIQAACGGPAFGGDWWTISHGLNVVINELHYHPADPNDTVEFIELYNAGSNGASMANWTLCDGVEYTFPTGASISPGGYLVVTCDATLLETLTGYSGALQWTDGRLSNGGETVSLCDDVGNLLDRVTYADAYPWPSASDGDGPSLELINPNLDNEYGAAWSSSLADNGTPGSENSVYQASPAPMILDVIHDPPIPAPGQDLLVRATVIDDSTAPTVTLYYRSDQTPTVAYSSMSMLDDGFHGDGVAGDNVYGAIVPGLSDGERLDFTVRASDGTSESASPPGHDTLVAGEYPSQTYLCKFEAFVPDAEFPTYHMITTARTRELQGATIDRTNYDATFIQCDTEGNCEIFYNIEERYRGHSTLTDTPHGFRVNFSDDHPLSSEMGFEVVDLVLMAQEIDRQYLGYRFFREAFGGSMLAARTQFVRFNTNPLAHGGVQDWIYINLERVDDKFLDSQGGSIFPERFPAQCSEDGESCDDDDDCTGTCIDRGTGNLYRARHTGDLDYRGEDPDDYRTTVQPDGGTDYGYDKETNEAEDVWDELIDLCYAIDAATTSDETLEQAVSDLVDEDQWMRWFAIHALLGNGEGGLYRDSGDDYFLYFEPPNSPHGYNAKLIAWDLDSVWGGHWYLDNYWEQPTIWRSGCGHPCNPYKGCPSPLADTAGRLVRSNAFAGRFVQAICEMMNNEFAQANVDAMIDDLPDSVLDQSPYYGTAAARKTVLKNWVTTRRTTVTNEIVSSLTVEGIPASPYQAASPKLLLNGQLNQCGTHSVVINGEPVDYFSVFKNPFPSEPCGFTAGGGDWSSEYMLSPGENEIIVQCLDHNGVEIDRVESSVTYEPTPAGLRATMPSRMVATKTLTLKGELFDVNGEIFWQKFELLGSVSAWREWDHSPVDVSITVFEEYPDGIGGGTPLADSIRFYNGVGSVSITLDDPEAFAGEAIRVFVTAEGHTASRVVQVLPDEAGTFKELSGTLSGADLDWGSDDGVIHLVGDVTIPTGSTLTLDPGTLVMVDSGPAGDGTRILFNGSTIDAQGTEADPIYFFASSGPAAMSLPQLESNNSNSWRGFLFEGAGSSIFSHTFITGAGNGTIGTRHPRPPAIYLADSHSLTITDCVMADSPSQMLFVTDTGGGAYTISRCLFSRVGIGAEFIGAADYTLVVEDSWFTRIGRAPYDAGCYNDNGCDGDALHIDQLTTVPQVVRRCVLADTGDDVIDHSNGAQPIVEDCIIYDARDKTISLYYSGDITMTNCLVFDSPGGVRATGQPVFLTNCTFSRNTIIDDRDCNDSAILKSIFWPISVVTCCGEVDYTLVGNAGHVGCGTGNFSADPLFVDSASNGFDLQPGSPAIDAGANGERIGWLGFPDVSPCLTADDCDDEIDCTIDVCEVGVCHHLADCDAFADECNLGLCNAATGECEAQPKPDGILCLDTLFCNGDETCQSGVCTAGATRTCDDGLSCTSDSCDEDNDECLAELDAGNCLIDGACYSDDDRDPANDCRICDSTSNAYAWGVLDDGTSCDDGLYCIENESCTAGVCGGGDTLTCDDTLDCTTDSCNEEDDQCDNVQQNGTCLIDGVCYSNGDLKPGDPTYWCDWLADPLAWTLRPSIIYVSVDNPACVTGSGQSVPYEVVYCSIQDGVDDAMPGDTVSVEIGTYYEQLRLNKRVTVGGAGACDAGIVIDPDGTGYEGPKDGNDTIYAAVVFESGSSEAILQGVTISNANASTINGNSGIEIVDGGIDDVLIQRVCVSGVSGHGFGAYDSDYTWPPPDGWVIEYSVFSTDSSGTWSGMRPQNMDNLTIRYCDVGPTNYGGILLVNVNTAGIQSNDVHDTPRVGIQVDSFCTAAIDILGNEVWATNSEHTADYGDLRLYEQYLPDPHGDPPATITIAGNTFRDSYNGVCVKSGHDISTRSVVISGNFISGHSGYGAFNDGAGMLVAEGNWWGDATGPYDPIGSIEAPPCDTDPTLDANANGAGDSISGNVDYCPWKDCLQDGDCDDVNPCTDDACVDYNCVFTADDGNSCDDGQFCNGAEFCDTGICQDGEEPCDDGCEQCDETADECDWCIYDLDGDGFIGPGDFSFFAGCYGQGYGCDAPEYRTGAEQCCISNFDESSDSFVGPGDFAGFAGCFGLYCAECDTCWGPVEEKKRAAVPDGDGGEVRIELVAVTKPTALETTDVLPASTTTFAIGQQFYVELWATAGAVNAGLAAVHADVSFDGDRIEVVELRHSYLFRLFGHGDLNDWSAVRVKTTVIEDVGGCAPLGYDQLGMDHTWVKVATLVTHVRRPGTLVISGEPSERGYGVCVVDRLGLLDSDEILFGNLEVYIRKQPIEANDTVSSGEVTGFSHLLATEQ